MSVASSLADVLPSQALSDDWTSPGRGAAAGAEPEAVVHAESTEEVAATMRWASAHGVGVLPVASGQRLRGRPIDGRFVVLRTDRLRGLEIYEPADLTFTARAGTPMAVLAERLGAHGQWLPFDPPNVGARSLGGLVATGESGPVWMGYGELRNHVLGATVVTGDGRTLKLGGRVVKNVAGFDLLKPIVGSRGRLAVITSVCVRAFPRPAEDRLLVLTGKSAKALAAVAQAVGTAPIMPVSSVIVSPAPTLGADAALLVRLHGSKATVEADQRALERHCGGTFERAGDPETLLRAARDHASRGVVLVARVLPSRLAAAIDVAHRALGEVSGSSAAGIELAADTYMAQLRVAAPTVEPTAGELLRDGVERLGGTLSVHCVAGSGAAGGDRGGPAHALASAASQPRPHEAELAAGLERVFDPTGVLWPCRP